MRISTSNKAKFFKDAQIIDRNFITKWRKTYNLEKVEIGELQELWRLNPAEQRNYKNLWTYLLK